MNPTFSIRELFQFGWQKTREHSGLLFRVLLSIFGMHLAYALVMRVLGDTFLGIGGGVVIGIAEGVLWIGFLTIILKIAKGEPAEYGDILPSLRTVIRYFLVSLVSGIFILLGFIALIIPGIYLMLRFSFVKFTPLEGMGIRESLRHSSFLTQGIKWKLLSFFILAAILNIVGALLLLIGLLVTLPLSCIALAHLYVTLQGQRSIVVTKA